MSLSALRLRVVITYLHSPKHSKGLEPSMDEREQDKRQCQLYITNALRVRSGEENLFRKLQSRAAHVRGPSLSLSCRLHPLSPDADDVA